MKVSNRSILISFKLHLNDKIESEKTLVSKINRHLSGEDEFEDDLLKGVAYWCRRHNISFEDVVKHAKEMEDDSKRNMEEG